MSVQVKLWGVRGSLPTPKSPLSIKAHAQKLIENYLEANSRTPTNVETYLNSLPLTEVGGFGGNTACFTVKHNDTELIIDCGSGMRSLGEKLMLGELGLGRGKCHILLTHFHWDHLMGLPFFNPIFIPGNEIHFWAVQSDLEDNIRRIFRKPNFPINFEQLGTRLHFHQLAPRKTVHFDQIQVTPYLLDHPDACWGYRFDVAGKSIAHCVDSEMTRVSARDLGPDLKLYQNLDLAIMDAQYTLLEATERVNWGHGSASVGLDLAMREGIKKVLFIHHDPAAADAKIFKVEAQTREYYQMALKDAKKYNQPLHEVEWMFAHEGMEIFL